MRFGQACLRVYDKRVGAMAYEQAGEGPLDYFPCRYDKSRLLFRGPRRDLSGAFVAFLGGTETYGKFLREPFPALIEAASGVTAVNLGCVQAGPDAYLNDPATLDLARRASVTVVQVTGALNLSNRFYAVHPRRNDRFLRASPALQALYREVDFTEFAFTRHMVQTLAAVAPDKFRLVVEELRTAWVARMGTLLDRLPAPVVLLWLSDRPAPPDAVVDARTDPPLVTQGMVAALRPRVARYVEVVASAPARAEGSRGMAFLPLEEHAAASLPGPAVHQEAAAALLPVLRSLL